MQEGVTATAQDVAHKLPILAFRKVAPGYSHYSCNGYDAPRRNDRCIANRRRRALSLATAWGAGTAGTFTRGRCVGGRGFVFCSLAASWRPHRWTRPCSRRALPARTHAHTHSHAHAHPHTQSLAQSHTQSHTAPAPTRCVVAPPALPCLSRLALSHLALSHLALSHLAFSPLTPAAAPVYAVGAPPPF